MMTQTLINVIGFIIIGFSFYYFQIYRPKLLRNNPEDLTVKSLSINQMKLADIASRNFSEQYYVLSNPRYADIFHSERLKNDRAFKNHMLSMKCAVLLVDKSTSLPILALELSAQDDKNKETYMTGAGLGCLVFSHIDDELETIASVQDALRYQTEHSAPVAA